MSRTTSTKRPGGDGHLQLVDLLAEAQVGLELAPTGRSAATPSAAMSARTSASSSAIRRCIERGVDRHGRVTDRSRSRRTSVVAAPKAESTEASSGTSTRGAPMARAMSGVKSEPPPP